MDYERSPDEGDNLSLVDNIEKTVRKGSVVFRTVCIVRDGKGEGSNDSRTVVLMIAGFNPSSLSLDS